LHGKRYRERSGRGARDKSVLIRIIITVVAALAFAVLFSIVGIKLGKNADAGLTDAVQSTMPELTENPEGTTVPQFDFKDVPNVKSADVSVAKGEMIPYNTVTVRLSDSEGKLAYLSSVSSLMYGSSYTTTLKPIAAAVNGADIKSNGISLSFFPFLLESNPDFADACSLALIKELCAQNIDEIVLERSDLSNGFVEEAMEYVHSKEGISLGVLLSPDVLDGITSEKEKVLKQYYTAYDFCVLDFTSTPLGTGEAQTEQESTTGDETSSTPESAYLDIYSKINENALLIAKYSLRIRLLAPTVEALEEAGRLIEELGIENYEILSE